MNSKDRANLIKRINTIEGLTDNERSALLGLLRENKSYGLVWEDKPEDIEERLRDELPILTEVRERAIISEDKDAPNHILIEGDNLEALATLAYTHEGKIDVIYIDPPYNTGNKDFIYNDSYVDKEDSYRHSKWLSFMSRRLKIAKKLLSDCGVIFISIDDNELAQLKLLCDDIWGESNFITTCIWQSTPGSNTGREIKDEFFSTRGPYITNKLDRRMTGSHYSDALNYPIEMPDGTMLYPGCSSVKQPHWNWRWSKSKVLWGIENGFILFNKNNNKWTIYFKQYLKVDNNNEKIERTIPYQNLILESSMNAARGSKEVMDVFNEKKFDYPKPLALCTFIQRMTTQNDSIILDFFAGSGTTLHATMQLNSEDGGHRKCILVTNNENNICEEVTYERNRRVIQGYTNAKGEEVPGLANNNLRYYRTGFVSRSRSMQNMRKLVNLATDMLCIKEDLYTEQTTFGEQKTHKGIFRYFDDGNKKMLIIYREEAIDELVDIIYDMDVAQPIKVYVFSPSEDPWEGSFEDVSDKVELCALPQAIYNTYRRILPKKKDAVIMPEDDVLVTTEKEEEQFNGMLNFEYDEEA